LTPQDRIISQELKPVEEQPLMQTHCDCALSDFSSGAVLVDIDFEQVEIVIAPMLYCPSPELPVGRKI
jgi:hypothetical protein